MTLAPGYILQSRYRLGAVIKQGGMSIVYRAWDLRLRISVAIKELMPQSGISSQDLAQLREQFCEEATTLARLNHPNLVRVMDFFEEQGNAYLVMDFVEGQDLGDMVEQTGALSEETVLSWVDQLLDALDYCHSLGVVHRDIKPQNLIIRPDGQAVLVDFGLVKLWDPDLPGTRTVIQGVGTPGYAPPEQYGTVRGHTDARSDLYGLAATLYYVLTGQVPASATQRMAAPEAFLSVRALNPGTSARTEAVIMRAMQLPVDLRFPDAAEMRRALSEPVEDVTQRPLPLLPRLPLRVGQLALLSLGGLVILALIVGVALAVTKCSSPAPTPTAVLVLGDTNTATPGRSQTRTAMPTQTPMGGSEPRPTTTRTQRPGPTPMLRSTATPRPTARPTWTSRPQPTPTPTPVPLFYASVLVEDLNVRTGPGTNYAKVGQVHEGDCLSVWSWNGDREWLNITAPRVDGGWVSSRYVDAGLSSRCNGVASQGAMDPRFRADNKKIAAGQCTYLRWDVDQVKAVYLDDAGRPGHATQQVCPSRTRLYLLTVVSQNDRQSYFALTVQVSGSAASPSGPLVIDYKLNNIWCPTRYGYVAEFHIWASGGNGRYIFFRDIDRIGGPTTGGITYRLSWTSCGGAPGTFFVESGGQRAQKSFWVNPPACCTK